MSRYKIKQYVIGTKNKEKEIKKVINHYARKERYMEHDLKREVMVIDSENEKIFFCPSREDSFERLCDLNEQFVDESSSTESLVENKMMKEKLQKCLLLLSFAERSLIEALYYQEKTERELSKETGVHYSTIHSRKKKILEKLKKLLEN